MSVEEPDYYIYIQQADILPIFVPIFPQIFPQIFPPIFPPIFLPIFPLIFFCRFFQIFSWWADVNVDDEQMSKWDDADAAYNPTSSSEHDTLNDNFYCQHSWHLLLKNTLLLKCKKKVWLILIKYGEANGRMVSCGRHFAHHCAGCHQVIDWKIIILPFGFHNFIFEDIPIAVGCWQEG